MDVVETFADSTPINNKNEKTTVDTFELKSLKE